MGDDQTSKGEKTMTIQTVSNMKLIVLEMEKQTNGTMSDFKSLKALSHSYETLLSQLNSSKEDFKDHKLTSDIKSQQRAISSINYKLESKSIPELLRLGNYLDVNHLTTTTTRLNSIISSLDNLVIALYERYNEKVLIVSKQLNKSEILMYKLIEDKQENIVHKIQTRGISQTITTDKYNYITTEFSKNYRGRRADFVYIDKDLDIEEINFIRMNLKERNSYELF